MINPFCHCEEWAGLSERSDVAISLSAVAYQLCYLSFQPLPLWLSFFRNCLFFIGAQEGYAVLLKEKKQKFKKEGMLPPAGHTPGPPPLSEGPLRFFLTFLNLSILSCWRRKHLLQFAYRRLVCSRRYFAAAQDDKKTEDLKWKSLHITLTACGRL